MINRRFWLCVLMMTLAAAFRCNSQCLSINLIQNPGLEEYNCCPYQFHLISCANHWTQPLPFSSSEYLNTCAIDSMAAHSDGYSPRCSCTMRTARSRTSGENLVDLFMAPFSCELEPPQNPGRFTLARPSSSGRSSSPCLPRSGSRHRRRTRIRVRRRSRPRGGEAPGTRNGDCEPSDPTELHLETSTERHTP